MYFDSFQYHGCWWNEITRSQRIICRSDVLGLPEYSGLAQGGLDFCFHKYLETFSLVGHWLYSWSLLDGHQGKHRSLWTISVYNQWTEANGWPKYQVARRLISYNTLVMSHSKKCYVEYPLLKSFCVDQNILCSRVMFVVWLCDFRH